MKSPFAVAKKNALIPTLYLGNMSYKLNEEGLQKFLSTYGKITYLFMPIDKRTKRRKGIAFVQFSKKDEFEKALRALDGKSYMGRTLKASQAVENESMPFSSQEARKEIKEMPTTKKKKIKKGLELLMSIKK